jgi:hypothetical protein
MFANTFSNNYRTIQGGTTAIVYNDDSVLYCDTSTGAITINMGEIPANQWNTIWKLYVVDSGNNASTNNITINAGSGQTINGSSSLVISTNSESVVIRICGNAKFIASTSSTITPSSGYNQVQDEGTNLTQRTTINFTGDGVTASDNGSVTIVDIPFKPKSILLYSPNPAMAIPQPSSYPTPVSSNNYTHANCVTLDDMLVSYNDDSSMYSWNSSNGVLTITGSGIYNLKAFLHIGEDSLTPLFTENGWITMSIHTWTDGTTPTTNQNVALDTKMTGLYSTYTTPAISTPTYGTATQLTSKTTPVTLNALYGTITTSNAGRFYSGQSYVFSVNNTNVIATDTISFSIQSISVANVDLVLQAINITANSFDVQMTCINDGNSGGGSANGIVVFNFSVIKLPTQPSLLPAPRFIDLNCGYNGLKLTSTPYYVSLDVMNRSGYNIASSTGAYYHSYALSVQRVGNV